MIWKGQIAEQNQNMLGKVIFYINGTLLQKKVRTEILERPWCILIEFLIMVDYGAREPGLEARNPGY